MINKKTFVEIIKLIKEQEKIDDDFSTALETICDSWCLYGTKNKAYKALMIVLKEVFDDKGDWISWWLYEDVKKEVYIESFKGKKTIPLKTPEQLYDFLIKNMETQQKD